MPTELRPSFLDDRQLPSITQLFHADTLKDNKAQGPNWTPQRLLQPQINQVAGKVQFLMSLSPSMQDIRIDGRLHSGRSNAYTSFRKGCGRALYHIGMGVPDRLIFGVSDVVSQEPGRRFKSWSALLFDGWSTVSLRSIGW